MPAKFVSIDRSIPMLMPLDLRDWLPENHLVHFILDAVSKLNLISFNVNTSGSGSEQYPPDMLLALLMYCYATGRFSSRSIEAATHVDVAVRYICGGDRHPDHSTICAFRRSNGEAFKETFVKVLMLAGEARHISRFGTIAVDGTKIEANASKHSAVSYKRGGEIVKHLELEIAALIAKAESTDSAIQKCSLDIPAEITRRETRMNQIVMALNDIETRHEEGRAEHQAEYEEKMLSRRQIEEDGRKPRGPAPSPPPEKPDDKAQINFTDSESRIMKAGDGAHFEQSYNAQAAVEIESMLIVGGYVTDKCNDKQELEPIISSVPAEVMEVEAALADTGYFNSDAIMRIESETKVEVYCATGRQGHARTVDELFQGDVEPAPAPPNATLKEKMARKLKTAKGKSLYKKRKYTVEPVFGIIKEVLGFRKFLMRGLEKVNIEWDIIKTAYNLKRMAKLSQRIIMPIAQENVA